MPRDSLYGFVYKGLLARTALQKAGHKDRTHFTDGWEAETAARLGIPFLDEELVAKSRKMAVVYTAICAFENSVREFVSTKLLEEKGEGWWETSVNADIKTKAEGRRTVDREIRWLTPRGDSPIYYTDFGDLISIIGNANNWTYFEVHIGTIEWAKQIITTLEKSRNIIMHGGELAPTDIERVGMFIRDWVRQVG